MPKKNLSLLGTANDVLKSAEKAVFEAIDPSMNLDLLAPSPCILDHGRSAEVFSLGDDIEFAESICAFTAIQLIEFFQMESFDVLDVTKPIIDKPMRTLIGGCLDPSTVVVTDDHNVLHFENIDGELEDGKQVQVGVDHHVGDVAMHEDFARHEPGDLIGRHAAV